MDKDKQRIALVYATDQYGDLRNWAEIRSWAETIALSLRLPPARSTTIHP
ncbi:hypothetical protein [Nocardia sp. bgisy134]